MKMQYISDKMPAHNVRFGASGAVTPQTILCGFARYYPAGTAVEAPPAPSRHPVIRQRGTEQCEMKKQKMKQKNQQKRLSLQSENL
jgi:hypothetical protein